MSFDSGRQAKAQIGSLPSPSTSPAELWNLLAPLGTEGELGLLGWLVSSLPSLSVLTASPSKTKPSSSAQAQQLAELIRKRGWEPSFSSLLVRAYDSADRLSPRPSVPILARLLTLSLPHECILSVSFSHSQRPDLRSSGLGNLARCLPALFQAFADGSPDASGLEECPLEALLLLLHASLSLPNLQERRRDFAAALAENLKGSPSILPLLPFLPPQPVNMEASSLSLQSITGSLALQIQEKGALAFPDTESWEKQLRQMGLGDGEVAASSVAHVLAMMTRPSRYGSSWSGSEESSANNWSVCAFVEAVQRLQPSLDWESVVAELDQPGFSVKDLAALQLLHGGLERALGGRPFPLRLLYQPNWSNKEGQLSWISQILRNPDVFDLNSVPQRSAPIEQLKTGPEEWGSGTVWKSLELVESLLWLGESPGLAKEVEQIFLVPLTKVPDLLCLSLLHVGPPVSALRQELLGKLMPLLFGSHPSAQTLLHACWDTTLLPQQPMRALVLAAMSAWYMAAQDDQERLNQILEMAQELKALSPLLASSQLPFALDLACLASRRDFLNLDKWLADKLRDDKETFVEAILNLIQRRGPNTLPPELLSALLQPLQPLLPSLSLSHANQVQQLLHRFPQSAAPASATANPIMDLLSSTASSQAKAASAFPSGFGELVGTAQPTRNPFSAPTPTPFLRSQGPVGAAAPASGSVSPARGLMGALGGGGLGLGSGGLGALGRGGGSTGWSSTRGSAPSATRGWRARPRGCS